MGHSVFNQLEIVVLGTSITLEMARIDMPLVAILRAFTRVSSLACAFAPALHLRAFSRIL